MERIPKNRLNQAYWDARDSITDDWIKEQIENDKDFADKLQKIYDEALKLMQDDIYREYSKVSSNLPLAQQKVSQADIEELEKYAEKVVPKRDFSDEANKRMRLYNATMRINRLEMLKSQLGYELINAGLKVNDQLKDHLNDEYQAEIKRQAGIFGATVAPKSLLTNKHVASVVMAGVNGVDFSKRLWTDQDLLKAKLDSILIQAATTGRSNQELARKLVGLVSDAVKKKRYVTERIVRTETARVQAQAQKDMIDEYGFKYCKWHAEPSACRVCRNIAQDDPDGNGFGVYSADDVPSIPIHANCRCAISAYWVDEPKDSKGMSRKKRDNQRKPINKEKQGKLTADFRKNGGKVWQDDEAEEYLRSKKASAANFGKDTIVLQKKPTISEVLEEVYHANQHRQGVPTDTAAQMDRAEIEAQHYLIDMEKVYNIPKAEREQTRENLKYWLSKLKEDEGRES